MPPAAPNDPRPTLPFCFSLHSKPTFLRPASPRQADRKLAVGRQHWKPKPKCRHSNLSKVLPALHLCRPGRVLLILQHIYCRLVACLGRGIEDHMFSVTFLFLPQDRCCLNCVYAESRPDPRHPREDRPHSRSRCPCAPCESGFPLDRTPSSSAETGANATGFPSRSV